MRTGELLSRDFVMNIMQTHDDGGFDKRDPTSKKIHRELKVPIGINEQWSADGHDKLYGIGFPIWAIVDDATGRWLDAWVTPSNRMGGVVLYLFLCTVEDVGGMSFNSPQELLALTLLQECRFRLRRIVDQRQHSFMAWQRHCGELHLAERQLRILII